MSLPGNDRQVLRKVVAVAGSLADGTGSSRAEGLTSAASSEGDPQNRLDLLYLNEHHGSASTEPADVLNSGKPTQEARILDLRLLQT